MICLSETEFIYTLRIKTASNRINGMISLQIEGIILMCNFNQLNDEQKSKLHTLISDAAQKIGGMNFLLSLEEAIRSKSNNPLINSEMKIASNNTIIKWNKVIFKDKVELIKELIEISRTDGEENILAKAEGKKRKNIINMIRTLTPLEFKVIPQNPNDGEGFTFKVFDVIEDDRVLFNPLFLALFFCSIEFSKKAFKAS